VEPGYTATQGQYLAFIYYYTKLHGVPPAEVAPFRKGTVREYDRVRI
jgi:hypothetical protein